LIKRVGTTFTRSGLDQGAVFVLRA